MPRPPRVLSPEHPVHVVAKGNDGRAIVADDADRRLFVHLLDRSVRKHSLRCLAWCLMTTHAHLLLRAPDENLSAAMQELLGGFSRLTNRRHRRDGHLFHNRFFGVIVKTDRHLFGVHAYIVNNPVRAGLCAHPAAWRWSSYRAAAGLAPAEPLLALAEALAPFGHTLERARAGYRGCVREARPGDRVGCAASARPQRSRS